MNLGDRECNSELAYFLKNGHNPPFEEKDRHYKEPTEDNFNLLNYLEVNYDYNTNGNYKYVKGWY